MLCYGLTRFSEDIDLDGFELDIMDIVESFCTQNKFQFRVAKDTGTVKRFLIHYGSEKPLKVEVSYRVKSLNYEIETSYVNNILVYNIQNILLMKLHAYTNRDKIRDLFDVTYIALKYWDKLDKNIKFMLRDTLALKGIEQVVYVTTNQIDELIDVYKLTDDFLTLWEKLNLRI